MVLFPIAFLWVAIFMIWLIRQSLNEPDTDAGNDTPRRWFRRPRDPQSGPTAPASGTQDTRKRGRSRRATERAASAPREHR